MKILIIGGTIFLGRYLVEAAQARGHEVTLFNRGRHNSELFPEVEKLRGDRSVNLDALRGREWDAVIDTCGFTPAPVRATAQLLAERVAHYTFVSSISVYANFPPEGLDETQLTGTITDELAAEAEHFEIGDRATAVSYGELYGPLKARCEQTVADALPGRSLITRPGLIVGPHDYTDRFTYWPARVARGGEVLAPGRPERVVRVIDVRDFADWNIRMAETQQTGIFNASGADGLTMGELLDECKAVSRSDAHFNWVSEEFLQAQGVGAWVELPLWLPEEYSGIFMARNDKAIAAGLTFRPLDETIRDTLDWVVTRPADAEWHAGLKHEREQEILRAWRERQKPDTAQPA
jgi:2'-hydroxyisoflavone reductase